MAGPLSWRAAKPGLALLALCCRPLALAPRVLEQREQSRGG